MNVCQTKLQDTQSVPFKNTSEKCSDYCKNVCMECLWAYLTKNANWTCSIPYIHQELLWPYFAVFLMSKHSVLVMDSSGLPTVVATVIARRCYHAIQCFVHLNASTWSIYTCNTMVQIQAKPTHNASCELLMKRFSVQPCWDVRRRHHIY